METGEFGREPIDYCGDCGQCFGTHKPGCPNMPSDYEPQGGDDGEDQLPEDGEGGDDAEC